MRVRLALAALLLPLRAGTPAADIDVAVPPGLPGDWPVALPVIARDTNAVGPGAPSDGSVEVGDGRSLGPTYTGDAIAFAGIAALDMPYELAWARRQYAARPSDLAMHYPPPISPPLFWSGVASMCRVEMHPGLAYEHATYAHLVLLGRAAAIAAHGLCAHRPGPMDVPDSTVSQALLRPLAARLVADVGPLPDVPPALPTGGEATERMWLTLALTQLASGLAYDPECELAPRLCELGDTARPYVEQLTGHTHPLVRRNAVALLAAYDHPTAVPRLRELAQGDDPVVRGRALRALVDRRDRGLAAWLAARASGDDAGARIAAVDALGRMRDSGAEPVLVLVGQRHKRDAELLLHVVHALARLGAKSAPARSLLAWCASLRGQDDLAFVTQQRLVAPHLVVPEPGRASVLAQAALIAVASRGDPGAATWLLTPPTEDARELKDAFARLERLRLRKQPLDHHDAWEREGARRLNAAIGETRDPRERARLTAEYQAFANQSKQRGAEVARRLGTTLADWGAAWRAYTELRLRVQRKRAKGELPMDQSVELMGIAGPNKHLAVDVLARLGRAGHLRLLDVAEDPTEDSALRVAALAAVRGEELKGVDLAARVAALAVSDAVPDPTRRMALGLLARIDSARGLIAARAALEAYLGTPAVDLPGVRCRAAVLALGLVGADDADLARRVAAHADAEHAAAHVERQRQAGDAVLAAGWYPTPSTTLAPILGAAIEAMGRGRTPTGRAALIARLDAVGSGGRSTAARALGAFGDKEARTRLLVALDDPEPMVRLQAYLAVSRRGAPGVSVDWLAGTPEERRIAVDAMAAWAREQGD